MDTKRWYANTKGIQGLIYDESNGKNIAVSYDVEDALLIAAAPELLHALVELLSDVEYAQPQIKPGLIGNIQIRKAHAVIAKATS